MLIAPWILVLLLASLGLGCQPGGNPGTALTVAAAADLQPAFAEIGEAFQRDTLYKVVFTFSSSGTLAKQIEHGAPVDVFASANIRFVDELRSRGMILPDSLELYAVGRIVLATNKRSGVRAGALSDLAQPRFKRIAIANPEHAPYGAAARQALEATGLWEQVRPRLVFGEDVAQVTQYIRTGNVEAAIIALSLAGAPEIDYIRIDDALHEPLRQAVAAVSGTRSEKAAREFIAFVNGPKGRPVMKKYGFLLPGETESRGTKRGA
ncbi:MAG: molybdate ABC transporter substrate-binding protein [Chloroflexi bacterium]|nr:molybdate ABC transporter substrate-binding protein [Chloroflexota bacterium]